MTGLIHIKYKVFYKEYDSPLSLQGWLDKMYVEEHLQLVSMSENYFIFVDAEPLEINDGKIL